ncbi:ABC transporter permease [Limibaculum sp. FT325]|uniref:ABC transporter permease n=1 Tax=Thermohalobaculum sediminis TaxID=2939436 RepID=UPI0020C0B2BB|nr:ABC transporter permease [Limibaculum sediminis]MCL5775954.1 ABC transporter permease [Limibaculum sediminis]
MTPLPRWVELGLLPLANISLAFLVAGAVVALIGESPVEAMAVMLKGAFVYDGALGYTLYYTTNFMFTGLAVSVAFHAMLFNIGAEGEAAMGGLGAALVCIALDAVLPGLMVIPIAIAGAAAFGAAWAVVPGWLQARRGSHIVITTIMFNFIAAGVLVSLLSGPLMRAGQSSPQTRDFAEAARLPFLHDIARALGFPATATPLNLSFLIALLAAFGVWVLIWRTRWGYALRAVGHSEGAARYAGIPVPRMVVVAMAVSGALAGCMALNEILGAQGRLVLNFTSGYGFTGIAVALMGRNHPVGIFFAALLFGALYQGGAELDFEFQTITREMVVLIQGLIILFSGALALMFVPALARIFRARAQ